MASKTKRQRISNTDSVEKKIKRSQMQDTEDSSTDWVDNYRTEYESEEHWELRRNFMLAHQDRFDEQQLVCLAQTFVNMEFLGCKYPSETMLLVAELSSTIAEEFRGKREQRLKRTFVSASDVAEQRAKGSRYIKPKRKKSGDQEPLVIKVEQIQLSFGMGEPINLFQGLRYGPLIIHLAGGRNCLRNSCTLVKMNYDERTVVGGPNDAGNNNIKVSEILINNMVVATGSGDSLKAAKLEAFKQALIVLQSQCYSFKLNSSRKTIKVEKNKDGGVKIDVTQKSADNMGTPKLDESNKGYRIMRRMGWTGGGLGRLRQGVEEPLGYLLKCSRTGLGSDNSTDAANDSFRKLLQNYAQSTDIRDMQFEPNFNKEERVILHKIACRFGLRSSSYGTGKERRILISKKIPPETILHEVLIRRNPKYCKRYFVQVPNQKARLFPGNAVDLTLDDLDV